MRTGQERVSRSELNFQRTVKKGMGSSVPVEVRLDHRQGYSDNRNPRVVSTMETDRSVGRFLDRVWRDTG